MSILNMIFPCDEDEEIPGVAPLSWFRTGDELRFFLSCKGHGRILTATEELHRLIEMGFRISEEAEFLLKQAYASYQEGRALVSIICNAQSMHDVMKTMERLHLGDCPVALACIMREIAFDYQLNDFGLEMLVVMHQPVPDSTGSLCQLALCRSSGDGYGWLDVYYARPDGSVEPKVGFAFFVP